MSAIFFESVSKSFGTVKAVRSCDLTVDDGSFVAILGPSGCGKTTLLRMLGGFLRPDSGRILLGRKDITHLPPFRRNLGFVFQSYALFPHLSIAENLAFGLKMRDLDSGTINTRVAHYLDLVKLGAARDRYPDQLSGGQQQRVALARALAIEPDVLLLDEPLSALDRKLREEMQSELKLMQRKVGVTTLLVTHDQEEALTVADRVVVMSDGRVEQVGSPEEIYETPRTRFVAGFVGVSNIIDGWLQSRGVFRSHAGPVFNIESAAALPDAPGTICIRPEKISLHDSRPANRPNVFEGRVVDTVYQGQQTRLALEVSGLALTATVANGRHLHNRQTSIYVEIEPRYAQILAG